MRILAHVHRYPPDHNAGAEWMLHHTLQFLQGRGHEVRVCTSQPVSSRSFDGISIEPRANLRILTRWYQWCDVVLTHLDVTRLAMGMAQKRQRPLVHLVHNHNQLAHHRVTRGSAALVVYNSRWLAEAVAWPGTSMVLYPPVPPEAYRVEGPHDRVLLSNLIAAKGSLLVYALAERLPEVPFLLVRGAYGLQEEPPDLPNIEVVGQVPGMKPHLARTALLLMPSSYESWGRVAIEAACSGIPTIASHAQGLVESLAELGSYRDIESEQTVARPPPWGIVRPTPATVENWAETIRVWLQILEGTDGDRRREQLQAHAARLWAVTVAQLHELERRLSAL